MMSVFKQFDDRAEIMATLVVAGTGFLLAGALVMEHLFDMDPCLSPA
jgi:disulfide bond formation protein DsbB